MSGDDPVEIRFIVPPAGEQPSEFRRAIIQSIRDAIAAAAMSGALDMARADEGFRALSGQPILNVIIDAHGTELASPGKPG
jgi:hypothetical protein